MGFSGKSCWLGSLLSTTKFRSQLSEEQLQILNKRQFTQGRQAGQLDRHSYFPLNVVGGRESGWMSTESHFLTLHIHWLTCAVA